MEVLLVDFLLEYFESLGTLVPFVILISALLNRVFEISGTVFGLISAKQFLSWIISVVVVIVGGLWLNLGFLADLYWYWYVIYTLSVGLVANGIYDIEFIKSLLVKLRLLLPEGRI